MNTGNKYPRKLFDFIDEKITNDAVGEGRVLISSKRTKVIEGSKHRLDMEGVSSNSDITRRSIGYL